MAERQDGQQKILPALYHNMNRGQVGATLATFALSGVVDVVTHGGPTGLFIGGLAAFVVFRHSNDVMDRVMEYAVPGMNKGEQTGAVTDRVVESIAPMTDAYADQSVRAKLGRLTGFNLGNDALTRPKAEAYDERPQWEDDEEDDLPPPTRTKQVPSLFSSVLSGFTPTLKQIYLATTPEGVNVFCAAKDLCHVALAGNTGGGKSSIMRLLMSQLCKAGAQVLLLNPHYTRYDLEHDEDWTPFEPYLLHDPMECRKYDVIEHYLKQAATELLPRRLEKYAHSQPIGKPYFIVLDEMPAIVKHNPNTPDYLGDLLQQGRKVGIFLISASQGFLIKTIGGDGSVRDCYRTAFYVGGDPTTARALLDMPANVIPEDELGKGPAMLRCAAVPDVKKGRKVRVPYVDNAALYRLLGPSTYQKDAIRFEDDEPDVLLRPEPARQSSMPVQRLQPRPSSMPSLPMREQPQRERMDMRAAIRHMREAGWEERDIMRVVGMPASEYRRVVADMDGVSTGGSREVPADDTYTHSEHNLTVFPVRRNLPPEPPDMGTDEPVEGAEFDSEEFQPGPNDLLLSGVQAEVLIAYYRKCNNVEKSLAQIRNEKGQGLGGRYTRHASYILEQRGLKKIKRA